jgi:tetratricopeptide (TPR) repeat protein
VSVVLCFHSVPLGESPPPAPRDCFGRDELVELVVGLAENLEPIALIGAGGIGKTAIALTVLHHDRIVQRFGGNRRFIRCDQFPASRTHFLARLSEVIGAGVENPKDLTPLRPHLSSKEILIVLDNAESILDPKETGAREIHSVVDELCQFKTICLCITSRITTVPPRCERPEIPTLSIEAACDIFYGTYRNIGRSSVINDLLKRLDFHALSIKLLATTASHNGWDHDRVATEWDAQRAQVLHTDYNESLAATIELSLSSPTFLSLGPDARDLLGVVAFFPQGVNEKNLDWLFPTITNRKNAFDKFCVLSLAYRSNGFITMLAPIRDFLRPQDPLSSPILCATRDLYFGRLSVDISPGEEAFEEARWIVLEDVNVEHLLDVFSSIDQARVDNWDVCSHFIQHLVWHKPRQTILGSKIEALPDDHPSKPKCLTWLSWSFQQIGNHVERKRLLILTLELERQRGHDAQVAETLQSLSGANRCLDLHEEGIRRAKEALEIFERINHTVGQARSLESLARSLLDNKQFDAAEDAASRAINLISKRGEEYNICSLHRVLGEIHRSKGEKEKAIHHFKTAIGIASPLNWSDQLFWNHHYLAGLFRGENQLDDANAHAGQAKSYAVDNPYRLGSAMYTQANIWRRQDRLEDAKSEALHALGIFEKLGDTREAGFCRDLLQLIEQEMQNQRIGF